MEAPGANPSLALRFLRRQPQQPANKQTSSQLRSGWPRSSFGQCPIAASRAQMDTLRGHGAVVCSTVTANRSRIATQISHMLHQRLHRVQVRVLRTNNNAAKLAQKQAVSWGGDITPRARDGPPLGCQRRVTALQIIG